VVTPTWVSLTNDENNNNFKANVTIPNTSRVEFDLVCPPHKPPISLPAN
jgi:hypothetical protein